MYSKSHSEYYICNRKAVLISKLDCPVLDGEVEMVERRWRLEETSSDMDWLR
jgi:hypothetical protein